MTGDEQVDAALLAEVTSLLTDYSGVAPAIDQPFSPAPTFAPGGLLLDSHSFFAETETLLSSDMQERNVFLNSLPSFKQNDPFNDQTPGHDADKVEQLLADQKREFRNAQAAKRRLRYRQKLKDEKETLQQQETQLSSELSKLQEKREAARKSRVNNLSLGV
ncbi:hypothetical protein V7S43_004105 [Phytophthora oleae]|uniref:BZIP domain-containing protein n=1 Tax=Phytophthora oleae TaxID=2107226 RepID=A0ABD3FVH1_9STRA